MPKTTIVLNDSKVEKIRLRFGAIEIFILETISPMTIRALVRPGKKFRVGKVASIRIDNSVLNVRTEDVDSEGIRTLNLSLPIDDKRLDEYRLTPLPPYIAQNESLSEQYQTVYADPLGSKAAPTAGLHFTTDQLKQLSKDYVIAKLTLHVGLGTFAAVKTEDISRHKMHSESYFLSEQSATALNSSTSITAVGTTSLRVLETLSKPFDESTGETDIFITPGYKFKAVDSLITNFHLPKSTLLMLVAAFIGSTEEMQKVYQYAIDNKYRFYSFGDAMIII